MLRLKIDANAKKTMNRCKMCCTAYFAGGVESLKILPLPHQAGGAV